MWTRELFFAGGLMLAGCGGDDATRTDADADTDTDTGSDTDSCTGETQPCEDACVDLATDAFNCGGCGDACEQNQICDDGFCVVDCGDLTECSDECANLDNDPGHCGNCSTACAKGEECVAGNCQLACGGELVPCDAVCADLQTDPEHCGACDAPCDVGEVCNAGECGVTCDPGLTVCDGACIDTATDPAHCGGCGDGCAYGESCVDSACFNDGCIFGIDTREEFTDTMVGCAGVVAFADRDTLCSDGWTPCSAVQWRTGRGGDVPSYDYWTNDSLRYDSETCGGFGGGCVPSETGCFVDEISGTDCGEDTPMRVCTPDGDDPLGNQCNWTNCGYRMHAPNHYFGGCAGNNTAGTLCCQ